MISGLSKTELGAFLGSYLGSPLAEKYLRRENVLFVFVL